jgi:hypothetical protein
MEAVLEGLIDVAADALVDLTVPEEVVDEELEPVEPVEEVEPVEPVEEVLPAVPPEVPALVMVVPGPPGKRLAATPEAAVWYAVREREAFAVVFWLITILIPL